MMGIYCYIDKKDNKIVYVGKDSYIDEYRRYYAHKSPCNYNVQKINQVLQSNPNRYTYQILSWSVPNIDTLNALEISYIQHLKPKYNFTNGGDGSVGYKHSEETLKKLRRPHSEETKRKIGKSNMKQYARVIKSKHNDNGMHRWRLVYQNHFFETKDKAFLNKLAVQINNKTITFDEARQCFQQKRSQNLSYAASNANNTTGFYRVTKQGNSWKYKYTIANTRKCLSSTSLKKLKKKVLDNNLEWRIINEINAKKSIKTSGEYNNDRYSTL